MTREEALQLLAQGRGKWNSWAQSLLERFETMTDNRAWETLSYIDFSGHDFSGQPVDFDGFIFPGNVNFSRSIFPARTSFAKAVFHGEANFYGADFVGNSSFVKAQFSKVPNFAGAHFAQSPQMLDMSVQRPGLLNRDYRNALDDPEKFSVLGKMAKKSGEEGLAHHFHGSHIVARRHISEQWWQAGFWGSILYQLFSNFGQSLMRPFVAWVLSIFTFAWLYALYYKPAISATNPVETGQLESFWNAAKDWFVTSAETSVFKVSCAADEGGVFIKALYLSLKNAVLGLGGGGSEKMLQVYACLYGVNTNYSKGGLVPYIPDAVAFWGIMQLLFSAMLVFFFCLALFKRFSREY